MQIAALPLARDQCEKACIRLCNEFAWAVDGRHYDQFVALFALDGVFDRAGQISRGRAEILQFLNARPADKLTRHVCTNICITMIGPAAASGRSYASVFQTQTTPGAALPVPTPTAMVVEYHDDYALTNEGWKFKNREVKIIFQP